jgi:hypothetical protein
MWATDKGSKYGFSKALGLEVCEIEGLEAFSGERRQKMKCNLSL